MHTTASINKKIFSLKGDEISEKDFSAGMDKVHTFFQADEYNKAVDLLCKLIAMGEAKEDFKKAALKHNLASALHALGAYDAAKPLYAESYKALEASSDACCGFCSAKPQQLAFMADKAALAEKGELPPPHTYIDNSGMPKTWTASEMEKAKALVAKWAEEEAPAEPAVLTATAEAATAVQNKTVGLFASIAEGTIKTVSSAGDLVKSGVESGTDLVKSAFPLGHNGNGNGKPKEMI